MIQRIDIIKQVKETLPVAERDRDGHIDRSFLFAVADFSTRLMKQDRLSMNTESVALNTRELSLTGDEMDMDTIYYLLYGTGDDQVVLEYADQDKFFKDYNSSEATASTPSHFTFIGLDDSDNIRIRFNCPADSATTMEVWYYKEVNAESIRSTEGPVLVNFTLAYFWGVGSQEGLPYHRMGTTLIKSAKANAKRVQDNECGFVPNRFDKNIAALRQTLRNSR